MALETHGEHEKESHSGAYAAAAAAAGLLMAGAVWYATKGRAAQALPEIEAELGLASRTSGSDAIHELVGMVQHPSDLKAAARLLNPDISVLTPARYPLTITGDTVHGGKFDIDAFFRMCAEAPGGFSKFDTVGGVPRLVEHIPFATDSSPLLFQEPSLLREKPFSYLPDRGLIELDQAELHSVRLESGPTLTERLRDKLRRMLS